MRSLAALVPSLPLGTCLLLSAACFGAKPPAAATGAAARGAAANSTPDASEAAALGRELFGIMDRVLAYKSDHFAQLPKDLPTMGVDSLTRTTVRRLSIAGGVPTLVVAYRHTEGHALTECAGTNAVIEDSMLNGGAFEVECTLSSGEKKKFNVGG